MEKIYEISQKRLLGKPTLSKGKSRDRDEGKE